MRGLIRNSIILLSGSYVQHCIVMITGTVHIGGIDFRGQVGEMHLSVTMFTCNNKQYGMCYDRRFR